MLMRLSNNTYVRQYGPYTYIRDRHENSDEMFKDAEPFFRWLTRTPMDRQKILANIVTCYEGADALEIENDFNAIMSPLVVRGMVLEGDSVAELAAKDRLDFSYSDVNPRTIESDVELTQEEYENMPQCVLGNYFREHPTLFDLQLDITQACTERCVHCYVPEYNPVFLPFEKICEVIKQHRELGGLNISFSGGECMMHPDFDRIVKFARENDLIVSVLSNLTLCDDAKVKLLKESCAFVQVSLYSMNPEIHDAITRRPGSWAKTKDAIERLHAADVPMKISCPTMRQNFEGYVDVIKYAEGLKISAQTDFIMMAKADHDSSNLANRLTLDQTKCLLKSILFDGLEAEREYFDPKHKEGMQTPEERAEEPLCGAGVDKMCLNADGNYYPCSGFQDYPVGNCYKQTLREVWENSQQLKYIRGLRGKDIQKCVHCENRNYCSMCLVRNFNETGDMLNVADHFCKVAELNRQVVEEYHNQLRKER